LNRPVACRLGSPTSKVPAVRVSSVLSEGFKTEYHNRTQAFVADDA
jgi:hypothetical protein